MRLTNSIVRRRAAMWGAAAGALAALAIATPFALAQVPQGQQQPLPVWAQPKRPQQAPAPAPAAGTSTVVARVGPRTITQSDFDKMAQPYFQQLRQSLGPAFNADMMKIAQHNVLDELIRREVLALEVQRLKIVPTEAEVDALLMLDPFFVTNGKFDAAKFSAYKTTPGSNYLEMLPRFREMAAMNKVDDMVRKRIAPTSAQVRAEWEKRNDQVRVQMLPLLVRDVSIEPEATEAECQQYYQAHPDPFMRRTRLSLRYHRQPLPAAGDSTRPAAEALALARARALADSLRHGSLPDTAAELTDSGPFDLPAQVIPTIGRAGGLLDTLNRVDQDSTIRVVGPYTVTNEVIVGVIRDRRQRYLQPLREVLGDVKRRADAEKRRVASETERRAFYDAHPERWRTARASLTRVNLDPAAIPIPAPPAAEIERWYAQHGHSLFGLPDSSRAWMPPITDSLRTVAIARMTEGDRAPRAAEAMAKIAAGMRSARDARGLARTHGAVAETLTVMSGAPDTLFPAALMDSLVTAGRFTRGAAYGPRQFGRQWTVWRVDKLDTAFVPPYEAVRARSDQAFNEERSQRDEAAGKVYFDQHRGEFKTPVKYGFDYVMVPIPPPDSVRISDADVRRYFTANAARYRQEEQVQVRHILFMTRDAAQEAEKRAKVRADSLLGAIRRGGGDFADLARRFSQEPGAEASGGDLGWFGRGRMVKEFEDAAFALKPGTISGVVKTQFGYHIIKTEAHKAAGMKALAEVREEIRTTMARTRGDSTALRAANAVRRRLTLGGDEKTIAAGYGGVITAPPIAINEALPAGYPQGMAQDLPRMRPGKWAPGVYRTGSSYLALRLRDTLPERPAEFEEVKAQAVEAEKSARRRAIMDQKVASIRAALAAGASLDSVAAPYGGLRDSGPIARSAGFMPMLGNEPRIVQMAFAIDSGMVSDTLQAAQGVVWLRSQGKIARDPTAYKQAAAQIEAELSKQRYDEWLEQRKKTVKIEILRADLKRPRPSPMKTVTMSQGG